MRTSAPRRIEADRLVGAVFDTDGVLTETAALHAAAWKSAFDPFLADLPQDTPAAARTPFDIETDYLRYVDGRSREDGALAFLDSRGLSVPGATVEARRQALQRLTPGKEELYLGLLAGRGVTPRTGSVAFVEALRSRGVPTAAVSASRHCREVLDGAGLAGLFDVRVDGVDAELLRLPGKPDPALFLEAARRLGTPPGRTLLVEDSVAGIEAARRGGFSPVIGLDRGAGAQALAASGADLVVGDLAELLPLSP